jgi:hypothetical protein
MPIVRGSGEPWGRIGDRLRLEVQPYFGLVVLDPEPRIAVAQVRTAHGPSKSRGRRRSWGDRDELHPLGGVPWSGGSVSRRVGGSSPYWSRHSRRRNASSLPSSPDRYPTALSSFGTTGSPAKPVLTGRLTGLPVPLLHLPRFPGLLPESWTPNPKTPQEYRRTSRWRHLHPSLVGRCRHTTGNRRVNGMYTRRCQADGASKNCYFCGRKAG